MNMRTKLTERLSSHRGASEGVNTAAKQKLSEGIKHPLVARVGEGVGLGLGVVVTEALTVVPGWNARLVDANGQPVNEIEGARRLPNYDLRKRHQEVVGPQLTARAETMKPGFAHDLVAGMGKGATVAPGASYRLEARFLDLFTKK